MPAPLNLTSLIAAVRVELVEPVEGFWKDADITRWINDGYAELCIAARMEAGPITLLTVAQQEAYAIAQADFGQMRRVEREITAGTGLYQDMGVTTIDGRVGYVGTPGKWYVWNGNLYLIPTPDTTGLKLQYYYYKIAPTLAAGSDVPILPADYHKAIWQYAAAEAKRRADDPAFSTYQADFDNVKALMTQELFHRHQQRSYPVVQDDWKDTR